jgi:elongation factor 2
MAKREMIEAVKELMTKPECIRNIGTVAHIDHGKTTFSDNLLAGANMISSELAGKLCVMDFDPQEQERGITIFAANASMVHDVRGKEFLINLIDTPGHVDFGGDVTRAMRAVDGVIVLVDAVESVMPQTETVVRQALKERVKPVLFINKVDRLIRELKMTPESMLERFKNVIMDVNNLIKKYAEDDYKDKWMVNVNDGSVAFGSAFRKWGISVPYMQEKGITFKEIISCCSAEKDAELAEKAPLHRVVLDMVTKHLPNPLEAQKYRISKIWPGEPASEAGKSMQTCNSNGPLAAVVTKIYPDEHAGYVATVRIFSGSIKIGSDIRLVGSVKTEKVQQVGIYKGKKIVPMEIVYAGNIVGVVGLKSAYSGETLCGPEHVIPGFEAIQHIFEPVVTKAIEPKQPQQLSKLIEFLKKVSREDPTLRVKINEDTGEYLVSGLGELHIDAKIERPLKESGIDAAISPPIVIYRESTKGLTPAPVEGKSPNKHNKFYIVTEPMKPGVSDGMNKGILPSDHEFKKKDQDIIEKFVKAGMDRNEAKNVMLLHNKNMLLDMSY